MSEFWKEEWEINDIQLCSHCGAIRKGNVYRNKIWLCRKHYDQYRKFGKFLDNVKDSKGNRNEFVFNENYCGIILKNKEFKIVGIAIIDINDYELCKKYKWYLDSSGYARTSVNNHKVRLHRFLLKPHDEEIVDHINRNRLDCRRSNMRIVTRKENSINRGIQSNNNSGITGVYFTNGYWIARLKREEIHLLKYYKNKEDAINQRLLWEIEYFGDYAPQINVGGNINENSLI